ncbi:MAG: GNAT family N-acetyltransferase [Phycisphaerales bacterium]|nr:MAG: GNAT family N-acetyltransferase [Phycisphaerales bacterium]
MTANDMNGVARHGPVVLSVPQRLPASAERLAERARVRLRLATLADVPTMARIHLRSLPTEFLPKLGRPFLERVFFPGLLASPRACTYVAEDDAGVAGLIVTRAGMRGALGEMISAAPFSFLWTVALGMATRPSLMLDGIGVARQLLSRSAEAEPANLAELFLLCVHERARRRGVARALIEHSARELERTGVALYRVLLHADNEAAHATYRKCGFVETRIHRFGGVFFSEYDRTLAPRSAAAAVLHRSERDGRSLHLPDRAGALAMG